VGAYPTVKRKLAGVKSPNHRTFSGKLCPTAGIDFLFIHEALQFRNEFVRLEGRGEEFQHTLQIFGLYRFPGLAPAVKAVLRKLADDQNGTRNVLQDIFGVAAEKQVFSTGISVWR